MKLPIPAFFDRFASWQTELFSGLVAVVLAIGVVLAVTKLLVHHAIAPAPVVLAVAQLLSLIYERYFDANGFEWDDIGQRANGIVLSVLVWAAIS